MIVDYVGAEDFRAPGSPARAASWWFRGSWLFCWPDGRPIYPDTITGQLGRLADQGGLPTIRPHDVRHTYATMALRAGVNLKIISTGLGHATVAFTLDTCTADIPELDRVAAEQITSLFMPPDASRSDGPARRCLLIRLQPAPERGAEATQD